MCLPGQKPDGARARWHWLEHLTAREKACLRGFWAPWGLGGVFFVGKRDFRRVFGWGGVPPMSLPVRVFLSIVYWGCLSRVPSRPPSRQRPAHVPPASRPCPASVPPVSRPCPARVPPVSRPCPARVPPCPALSGRVPPVSCPSLMFHALSCAVLPRLHPQPTPSPQIPLNPP